MCGSSTDQADVDALTEGIEMDLCVTDPPYNVNLGFVNKKKVEIHSDHYKGANTDEILNDNMGKEEFHNFLYDAFQCMYNALKPGGSFYVWHAATSELQFLEALAENNLDVHQQLIWNKNSLTMGFSDYQWKHEPCFYGWKNGAAHYFIKDRTQTSVFEQKIDIDKMSKEEMKDLLHEIYDGELPTTVINEAKPQANDLHPTMKPIKLMARLVKNSSRRNEKVIDFFGGSGSTLIACEQLGRKAYLMELDPKYVDVIIDRWETLTGQKAKLIKRKKESR